MYSGTTFRNKSGSIIGVHQKIDRVARKNLNAAIKNGPTFPEYSEIVHFEGKNGPDGIKRKSPAIDEPWHFIDPQKIAKAPLLQLIKEHGQNLTQALAEDNQHRAAFEAAWMSHAIVDGLTPAHHFPLEETLIELRNGQGLETRTSVIKKNIMSGDTTAKAIQNNWKFWGPKGAMTTHVSFELGIASVIAYRKFEESLPTDEEIDLIKKYGFEAYFIDMVKRVADLKMYESFIKNGWTTKLARQTNKDLMPAIIRTVTLGWISAILDMEKPHES